MDMSGIHELGVFILAMRRGLDYLYDHPNVDRSRIGMTGLSGGGWQTIFLSSLDERITAAAPVAGFSSIKPRIEVRWYGDLGDPEQSPTDAFDGTDYTYLAALLAPRPSLIVHNAEDDCCFRGPLVKPLNFDAIKPIFKLYGKEDVFGWHENMEPSTHNYQLDNRTHVYHFFAKAFGVPRFDEDPNISSELKSFDELAVGLPKDNLSILGLARKVAAGIIRNPIPTGSAERERWASSEREKLAKIVRLKPARLAALWNVAITKSKGLESFSYLFRMENGLDASGVLARALDGPASSPATIVLDDRGRKNAATAVSERVNRGERVLALDLVFYGQSWAKIGEGPFYGPVSPGLYQQFLHAVGDRPLGLEAAQLIEIAKWLRSQTGVTSVRVETTGIRNQVVALAAAALEPQLFSELVVHQGMRGLGYLLEKPVEYLDATELFCLDLYKEFDLDRLRAIAAPTRVKGEKFLEDGPKVP
jgi:hypothetical protein